MTEIYYRLTRPPSRKSPVKCLSKERHNRMAREGFKPRPCQSQSQCSNHSTTLPTLDN